MKHVSLSLPLILLLSIACLAQDSLESRVDAYVKNEMQTQQIPGLSLAVIKDGRTRTDEAPHARARILGGRLRGGRPSGQPRAFRYVRVRRHRSLSSPQEVNPRRGRRL